MPAQLIQEASKPVFLFFLIALLFRQIRTDAELRALCRQLEEITRGSQIELCAKSRQPRLLALCQTLNCLLKQQRSQQLKYEKAQNQLKQNITSLAHDIRTPLTGAAGYVQLALEWMQDGTGKQQRYLQTALDRLGELGDMLEELFLYTKLTSEDFAPGICDIQVLPLLSDCLVSMYQELEEKGMAPKVDFASESFCVKADEECLRRIFHNLIRNALLHGTGELVIRQEENRLVFENRICVSQAGTPDMEQVFDRFYKADAARRQGSSGLGLFIVRELAEKMGGSVWAEMDDCRERFRVLLELEECR